MSFQIAPLRRVRGDFPEFLDSMKSVQDAVKDRGEKIWDGFTFGGITPRDNQFGVTNLIPRHMGITTTAAPGGVVRGFGSWSFMQRFTAPGSWVNIFSYNVPRDQIHGFVGFAFIGPQMPFTALRFTIGEKTLPIIDVEEAQAWPSFGEGIALILKSDKGEEFIAQEIINVQLQGFQERSSSGVTLRTVPIGLLAYRSKPDAITLSSPSA